MNKNQYLALIVCGFFFSLMAYLNGPFQWHKFIFSRFELERDGEPLEGSEMPLMLLISAPPHPHPPPANGPLSSSALIYGRFPFSKSR